jgi:MFS family permease
MVHDRLWRGLLTAEERTWWTGIWAGVCAHALSIGPLVGGFLTEHLNWNWIFFINAPIGAGALLEAVVLIPESRDRSAEQPWDVPGLAASGIECSR